MTLSEQMQTRLTEHDSERPQRIRRWLEHAVMVAYDRGELSEGQVSAVLNVERLAFREMYSAWAQDPLHHARSVPVRHSKRG